MRAYPIFPVALLAFAFAAACGDVEGNPIVAGDGDGGGDGSTDPPRVTDPKDGSADHDAESEPRNLDPMLAVASETGVHVWKHPAALSVDVAPDLTLAGDGLGGGATAVVSRKNHLWASRSGDNNIVRYDDASSLVATSTIADTLTIPNRVRALSVDSGDRLWANTGSGIAGDIFMFTSASTKGGAPTASFTHPFEQIMANAYEPASDRLFGGQISGAGLLAWNAAGTRQGTAESDFTVSNDCAYWAMQISGSRLYAAGRHSATLAGVAIWPDVASLSAPRQPIVVTNGFDPNKFISHIVVRDNVIAVAARDEGKVYVFKNAATIDGDRPADFTITHPSMIRPSQLAIDANGRLYAIDDEGVVVFANVGTEPTFVAKVKTGVGKPAGLALIE